MTLRWFAAAAFAAALLRGRAFVTARDVRLDTRQCPAGTLDLFAYCQVGQ